MLLRVIITFSICCSSAFAEKNFWDNEICTTDSDCSGLTSCHSTFGCTLSGVKEGLVMLAVFLTLCVIITAIFYLCRRNLRNTRFTSRPLHNQYLPQTVMTTNPTPWNQHQMTTTTTVYPHNPYPNQFYANSVNQPMYNQYQMDPRLGATMNVSQGVPTAPYPPAGFDYGRGHGQVPQTHYSNH